MNVGNPELAFDFQRLPNDGIGLARLEFIIARMIGIHPQALLELDPNIPIDLRKEVEARIAGYPEPDRVLRREDRPKASPRSRPRSRPKKVIVRLSDFKSNEYSNLLGGQRYEPHEENPMLGFRGASRYIAPEFHDCFELECQAIKRVRDDDGPHQRRDDGAVRAHR